MSGLINEFFDEHSVIAEAGRTLLAAKPVGNNYSIKTSDHKHVWRQLILIKTSAHGIRSSVI